MSIHLQNSIGFSSFFKFGQKIDEFMDVAAIIVILICFEMNIRLDLLFFELFRKIQIFFPILRKLTRVCLLLCTIMIVTVT